MIQPQTKTETYIKEEKHNEALSVQVGTKDCLGWDLINTSVHGYVCIFVFVRLCAPTYVVVCIYVCVFVSVCFCLSVYVCVYVYLCVYACACTYTPWTCIKTINKTKIIEHKHTTIKRKQNKTQRKNNYIPVSGSCGCTGVPQAVSENVIRELSFQTITWKYFFVCVNSGAYFFSFPDSSTKAH